MSKVWQSKPQNPEAAEKIEAGLGVSPLLARLLASRGFGDDEDAGRFLSSKLASLPDPLLIHGMAEGVKRTLKAIANNETIWVYSDFDVDGVSCAALLKTFFDDIGVTCRTWMPRRDREGYGLHVDALRTMAAEGGGLVITCDCGVSSIEEAREAKRLGLDLVITDHHRPGEILPLCDAIINPKIEGSQYPDATIAGVGVAWNFAAAVRNGLREVAYFGPSLQEPDLRDYLDFVALGTVSDLVPLLSVNRVLVSSGIGLINRNPRPGVAALGEVSNLRSQIKAGHLAYQLGPRINAAGRMDSPQKALDLLLAKTTEEARPLAAELNRLNKLRREEEGGTFRKVANLIREKGWHLKRNSLVVDGVGYHPGVIGIVASRLVDHFNLPSIVISIDGDTAKGSARSAGDLDLYKILGKCKDSLQQFGGHKGAAGMTLEASRVEEFRESFERVVTEELAGKPIVKTLEYDATGKVGEMTLPFMAELSRLEPFGCANPTPLFYIENLKVEDVRSLGEQGQHLRFRLGDKDRSIEAILWEKGHDVAGISQGTRVNVIASPRTRHRNGRTYVQLQLKDIARAG